MGSCNDSWLGIRGIPWSVAVLLNISITALVIYGIVALLNHKDAYRKYTVTYSLQDRVSGTPFTADGEECISAHNSYSQAEIIKRFLHDKNAPTGKFAAKTKINIKAGCPKLSISETYKEKERK